MGKESALTQPNSHSRLFQHLLDWPLLVREIAPGASIIVGVSGGADSVALLRALCAARSKLPTQIAAVHVNHGLREQAASEEQFVRQLCCELGVPCHVRAAGDFRAVRDGSDEAYWRELRYEAYRDVLTETSADCLALGHNANDLAETFLFHLARGTGVDGLVFHGVSDRNGIRILRPLWRTRREAIEMALHQAEQRWVEDTSNADQRHRRNHIRHTVIPGLQKINPDAISAILRASEAIGEVASLVPSVSQVRLPLSSMRGKSAGEIGQYLRQFVRGNDAHITSRQGEQAVGILENRQVGMVSLAGSKTLVITQQEAWISQSSQPDSSSLAQEHLERFGGMYFESDPIFLNPSARQSITDLIGKTWTLSLGDDALSLDLRSRKDVDAPWIPQVKKLLNSHKVPWYLRDNAMIIFPADGGKPSGVLTMETATDLAVRHGLRIIPAD